MGWYCDKDSPHPLAVRDFECWNKHVEDLWFPYADGVSIRPLPQYNS